MRKHRAVALVLLLAAATTGTLDAAPASASGLPPALLQDAPRQGGPCRACIGTALAVAAVEVFVDIPVWRWFASSRPSAAKRFVAGCTSACKIATEVV